MQKSTDLGYNSLPVVLKLMAAGVSIDQPQQAFTIQSVQEPRFLVFERDNAGHSNVAMHFSLIVGLAALTQRVLVLPSTSGRLQHCGLTGGTCRFQEEEVFDTHALARYVPIVSAASLASRGCQPIECAEDCATKQEWLARPVSGELSWLRARLKLQSCNLSEVYFQLDGTDPETTRVQLSQALLSDASVLFIPKLKSRACKFENAFAHMPRCDRFRAASAVFHGVRYQNKFTDFAAQTLQQLGLKVSGTYDVFHWRRGDFSAYYPDLGLSNISGRYMAQLLASNLMHHADGSSRRDRLPLLVLTQAMPKGASMMQRHEFDEFVAAYPSRVTFVSDWLHEQRKSMESLTRNLSVSLLPRVIADLLLALPARRFVGTTHSTFSMRIMDLRRRALLSFKDMTIAQWGVEPVADMLVPPSKSKGHACWDQPSTFTDFIDGRKQCTFVPGPLHKMLDLSATRTNFRRIQLYHLSKCGGTQLMHLFNNHLLTPKGQQMWLGQQENQCDQRFCERRPDDVFILATVRNPFAAYVSYWHMIVRMGMGNLDPHRPTSPIDPLTYTCIGRELRRRGLRHVYDPRLRFNATTFDQWLHHLLGTMGGMCTNDGPMSMSTRWRAQMHDREGREVFSGIVFTEDFYPSLRRALMTFEEGAGDGVVNWSYLNRVEKLRQQTFRNDFQAEMPYSCFYAHERTRRLVEWHDRPLLERWNYSFDSLGPCKHNKSRMSI